MRSISWLGKSQTFDTMKLKPFSHCLCWSWVGLQQPRFFNLMSLLRTNFQSYSHTRSYCSHAPHCVKYAKTTARRLTINHETFLLPTSYVMRIIPSITKTTPSFNNFKLITNLPPLPNTIENSNNNSLLTSQSVKQINNQPPNPPNRSYANVTG